MTTPIQSRTRLQIRQSIGRNTKAMIASASTATSADTTSLTDTYGLQKGGTDEYKGRQVQINELVTGGPAVGEKAWVTAHDATNKKLTTAPAFTDEVQSGTDYEMWEGIAVEDVNDLINQVISDLTNEVFKDKITENTFVESSKYKYDCLSSFVAVDKIEYVKSETETQLHSCNAVWSESVDGDVTATADTTVKKEGTASLKLVIAAGASANDILATTAISSTDLSSYDQIEVWILSSATFAAGAYQLLLDNTASCASPVESLNIPATTANVWTRHVLTLANPQNDTAIISIGIKMITDTAATIWCDDIEAVKSRVYDVLPDEYWSIIKGSTSYLQLTENGLSLAANYLIRITGYQKITLFSADTDTADVDPAYLIDQVTGELFATHMVASGMETEAREEKADYYLSKAANRRRDIMTVLRQGTKFI